MSNSTSEKKQLALLIPSLTPGGAERVFSTLANALVNKYHITLFVLFTCEVAYPIDKNIEVVFCAGKYQDERSIFKSIRMHYVFLQFLRKEIKKRNAQLILSFTTTTNVYAILVGNILKIPSIISERLHPDYGINRVWKTIRRALYPYCSVLVVQTESSKIYFDRFISVKKIRIIENPITPTLADSLQNILAAKEKIILSVGRLDYQKNQDLLIRAFSKIQAKDWKLVLVGNGNKKKEYETLVSALGIQDAVTFTGVVSNVSPYLSRSSIFVLSSRFEGFPNALIEAMYFGLACIATQCPSGPSELIRNYENGILIPVEDEMALVKSLNTLINNPSLRQTFGDKAKHDALRFETEPILEKWEFLIKNTLGK
ncbi:MAG TPA: glycosyltransferase family 4 protein [Flavobacteriaceae bacterium]|nr:glycosyltransferase family 4 protein [Flavobacteriaceae bacterium]